MVVCPPVQMCPTTLPLMAPPPPPQIFAAPIGESVECFYQDPNAIKMSSDAQMDVLQRSFVSLEIVDHQCPVYQQVAPVAPPPPAVIPAPLAQVRMAPGNQAPGVRTFTWSPTGGTLSASPNTPTTPPSNYTPFSFPANWGQSYGMELVWHGEFVNLFQRYSPNVWYLTPMVSKPSGGRWNYFMDSAKVRFCCEECGHGWTSMKGRVVFWYNFDNSIGEGIVAFKLYGQKCQKCKSSRFESSMWYPEEVVKVLANIYNKVGQVYYGFYQPPIHKARRPGKPRNPHNQDLCQACQDGVCSEKRP